MKYSYVIFWWTKIFHYLAKTRQWQGQGVMFLNGSVLMLSYFFQLLRFFLEKYIWNIVLYFQVFYCFTSHYTFVICFVETCDSKIVLGKIFLMKINTKFVFAWKYFALSLSWPHAKANNYILLKIINYIYAIRH